MRLKRDDEHRVDELRRTLYQSTGQADGGPVRRDEDKSKEELLLERETRRRKQMLKQEQSSGLSFPNRPSPPASPPPEEAPKSAEGSTSFVPLIRQHDKVVDVEMADSGLSTGAAAQVKAAEEKAKP